MGVIVWYKANIDYVATELCENKDKPELKCNGKCYLKKQLNKVDNQQEKDKAPAKKVKDTLPEYIASSTQLNLTSHIEKREQQYTRYINLYKHQNLSSVFHPPTFC